MITLENVSFQVKEKRLLQDVTVMFAVDKTTLIVGPNGAGKSTLLKLISQELRPTAGKIRLGNEPLETISKNELAKFRGVLSQSNAMAFPMSVLEVVQMGRYPHFRKSTTHVDAEICREAMALFAVESLVERNFQTLSGGEKQRVHFARVAAQIWPEDSSVTKILLLDEPLTYLDIFHQHEFMKQLQKMAAMQPMAIVGVVHDLNLALKYADEIMMLSDGKMHDFGAPKKVLSEENMQQVFKLRPHFYTDEAGRSSLYF